MEAGDNNQGGQQSPKLVLDPLLAIRNLMCWNPEPGPEGDALGPAFDIKETRDTFVFLADLPGLRREQVEIMLRPNLITIKGHRPVEKLAEDENYYALERTFGPFCRQFRLPDGIDAGAVSASIQDGVLTVKLPKTGNAGQTRVQLH